MSTSKILIRLDQKLHVALKVLAIDQSTTLNQLCLDLIEKSMAQEIDPLLNSNIENKLDQILKAYQKHGLTLVLETKGYLAEYVLMIENHLPIPEHHPNLFLEIIQVLHIPKTENPPNKMWIEIAKYHKIIWGKSKELEITIEKKLNAWKELL